MRLTLVSTFLFAVLMPAAAPAGQATQAAAPPDTPVVAVSDYLVRDGGRWVAANPDYTPGEPGPPEFGYAFEYGLGRWIVKGRIFGIYPDGREPAYWESITSWNPTAQRVEIVQVGHGGARATGSIRSTGETTTETLLTFVMGDGETWEFRETEDHGNPDRFVSVSHRKRDGVWQESQRLEWRRVAP